MPFSAAALQLIRFSRVVAPIDGQEQILIHDGMMYVATDDYPYVLKVPTPGLTNSSDFNATQWQPTGGGVALYWRPAVDLQGSAIKGAAWGLRYTVRCPAQPSGSVNAASLQWFPTYGMRAQNASGVGPGVLVSTQANELYLLSVNNAGYDNVSLVHSDTSAFGPLRYFSRTRTTAHARLTTMRVDGAEWTWTAMGHSISLRGEAAGCSNSTPRPWPCRVTLAPCALPPDPVMARKLTVQNNASCV